MKKSELRQIIREEIKNLTEAFKVNKNYQATEEELKKLGFKKSTSGSAVWHPSGHHHLYAPFYYWEVGNYLSVQPKPERGIDKITTIYPKSFDELKKLYKKYS